MSEILPMPFHEKIINYFLIVWSILKEIIHKENVSTDGKTGGN